MPARVFTLDYELSRDDLLAYTGFGWATSMLRWWIVFPVISIFGASVGLAVATMIYLIAWLAGLEWDPLLNFFFPFLAGIGIVMAITRFREFDHDKWLVALAKLITRDSQDEVFSQEEEASRRRRTLSVTSHGIEFNARDRHEFRTWDCITRVAVTECHVFILCDVTFIVPQHAFADDTTFSDFIEAVRRWSGPQ